MKKAASIFLRSEVTKQDITQLSCWMERPQVTRYLNEHTQISHALDSLILEVRSRCGAEALFGGRFYFICFNCRRAIGFISLKRMPAPGIGRSSPPSANPRFGARDTARALRLALQEAFYPRTHMYCGSMRPSIAKTPAPCVCLCTRDSGRLARRVPAFGS
jgi:RimJ/RimL family protein N-acetyltransferase